jgi:hypothetical protein
VNIENTKQNTGISMARRIPNLFVNPIIMAIMKMKTLAVIIAFLL